jgi:hypothetical protein
MLRSKRPHISFQKSPLVRAQFEKIKMSSSF